MLNNLAGLVTRFLSRRGHRQSEIPTSERAILF